jgi:hypothetical protein
MEIGCLAPHVLQDEPFVASLGELRQFNSSTMRSHPANDPPILDSTVRIRLPD